MTASIWEPQETDERSSTPEPRVPRRLRLRLTEGGAPAKAILATVLGIAILTIVAWLRLPAGSAQTLWAEDGGIFLRQAANSSVLAGIFDPYDGYLHVVPRILSHIALRLGPLDTYASVISWLSCFLTATVGTAVFHLSRQMFASVLTRAALAVIPVLLPVAPFEVLGNTANLHWYMLWLVVWVLLYRPQHWLASGGLAVAAFLAATTEIQTIVFLPVGVVAAWRDRKRVPATVALAVGLIMQVWTSLRFPRSVSPDAVSWDVPSVIIGWLLQGVESTVQPSGASVGAAWTAVGGWVLVVPALMAVFTAVLGWRSGGVVRFGTLGFLIASGVFWAAAQILNNREFMNYAELTSSEWTHFGYLRYAAAPGMFFLGAVAIATSGISPQLDGTSRSGAMGSLRGAWFRPMAIGGLVIVLCANFFPSYSTRWSGPLWSEQVTAARTACNSNPGLQTAVALVAPTGWQYGQVPLPCSRLRK